MLKDRMQFVVYFIMLITLYYNLYLVVISTDTREAYTDPFFY